MTLDKNCAGGVLTTPQNHIYSQISYYTLADLLYNILKIDEQATKYKITHTETSNGLYGGQKMKFAEPNFF